MIFEAVPITCRETQVQLPKGWSSLMRIIATGRCGNVLLNYFFFAPSLRNALFPQCKGTNYLFFRLLNQMQCIHAPPMCSGIAAAAITAGKDFAAAVAMFFLWHVIRQSCLLFLGVFLMHRESSALAPWPVCFSEPQNSFL